MRRAVFDGNFLPRVGLALAPFAVTAALVALLVWWLDRDDAMTGAQRKRGEPA